MMDAETKKTFEEMKKVVHDAVQVAQDEKAEREKLQKIVKELQEKQEKFETQRKGMFTDDELFSMGNKNHLLANVKGAEGINKLLNIQTEDEQIKNIQETNDDIMLISQLCQIPPAQTKKYQRFMEENPILRKAMDTGTSGEGSEWVPTGYSARLFDRIRLELMVANLHESIPMPTNVYIPPVVTSDATGYLIAEQTDDDATLTAANRIKASKPGTGNFTLTAKKIAGRTIFSEELSEDSIVPVLPLVSNNIVIAIGTAIEDAVINGDDSGTHQDSDITDSWEAAKAWKGYRKLAKTGAKISLATFNGDTLSSVRGAMGKYGIQPSKLALVCGINTYLNKLLNLKDDQNNPMVTTIDKYGASATILKGELGKVYGIPIIISEKVRENLNATGVYDGTTVDKTQLSIVYRPGLILGDRRVLKVKTAEDINTDQTVLVATTRRACAAPYTAAADTTIGIGYNIST
jgi:HK97 family phage major capsid protein